MNHSMDSTQNETLNSCFKIDFVRAFLTKWRSFISLFQALRKWKGAKEWGRRESERHFPPDVFFFSCLRFLNSADLTTSEI